jgi:8-oxo-dGTP pyrophosphatase MutT (NUDIX family)
MSAERSIALALPSSSVVLLREGAGDPELLMVRRRAGDAFGDSYTFPGGVVDDDEHTAHDYCQGITATEADRLLQISGGGLDFYSAAIRELFEETGVLMVKDIKGNWAPVTSDIEELRIQVDEGKLSWSEFLRGQRLHMACDALYYFAHWETPLDGPKRWSARFFLAEMPSGQDVRHDGSELTDSRWLSAAEALSIGRDGGMKIPFPTIRTLKILSEFASVGELLEWARNKAQEGVDMMRPVRIKLGDKSKFVIPGDPDYPA